MAIGKASKKTDSVNGPVIEHTIYADRVAAIMFGPSVSKIVLTMEEFDGVTTKNTAIVVPTSTLLDIVEQVNDGLATNADMRAGLIAALDNLKQKLISKGDSK